MKKNLILAVLLALIVLLSSCGPKQETTTEPIEGEIQVEETYKIGVLFPTTGDVAVYGIPMLKAVELAAEQSDLNIEIIPEDSRCEPQTAATAMQKLATVDTVIAVVGGLCSSETLAAAPIAEENHIVMVSPSSTNKDIATAGDYIFRVIVSDSFQGKVGALLAKEKGYTKAAVLYINNDYGAGLNEVFTEEFEAVGGDVISNEAFEQSSTDFRTLLTKVEEKDPDMLYVVGLPVECGNLLKQKAELGMDVAVIAAEGCKDASVLEVAGSGAEGILVTVPKQNTDEKYQEFAAAYLAAYGTDPTENLYTSESFDALNVILWAIKNSDGTKEGIKDALYKVQDYAGASGTISFDSLGEVEKPYTSFTVVNGEFVENT